MKKIIKNGTIVTASDTFKADLCVEDGKKIVIYLKEPLEYESTYTVTDGITLQSGSFKSKYFSHQSSVVISTNTTAEHTVNQSRNNCSGKIESFLWSEL